MKLLIILLTLIAGSSFLQDGHTLSKKERKFASRHLKDSYTGLEKSIRGLSQNQLVFKPAPDRWSIQECVFHLAMTEASGWTWVLDMLAAPANPEKRATIRLSDEQVIAVISDRGSPVKTREKLEPVNAKYINTQEALAALKKERMTHVDFVQTTTRDLRNHIAEPTRYGPMDAYQVILLLSGHTIRHTRQIDEIKADPGYPKN